MRVFLSIRILSVLITIAIYSDCFSQDNLESFQDKALYGFQDEEGNVVIPAKYQEAEDFSEGMAAVKLGGSWGYIDLKGRVAVPFQYDWAGSFSEGKATVKLKKKYLCIDWQNNVLFSSDSGCAGFKGGISNISYKDRNDEWITKYIDTAGKELFTISGFGENFSEGMAAFSVYDKAANKTKYGFINMQGKTIVEPKYRSALSFSEGLARVENDNGLFGYIDAAGKLVIEFQFNQAGSFENGTAVVHKGGKTIPGEYVEYEGGKWLRITKTGEYKPHIKHSEPTERKKEGGQTPP